MQVQIALICLQAVIIIAFAPLNVRVLGHLSLAHMAIQTDVSLYGVRIASIRLRRAEGKLKLTLNGKRFPDRRPKLRTLMTVPSRFARSGAVMKASVVASVGATEAKDSAMLCGILHSFMSPVVQNAAIYASTGEAFELDFKLNFKINLLQIAQIAL